MTPGALGLAHEEANSGGASNAKENMTMKLEEFIDALYAAGWTAPYDAQWTQISGVHAALIARAEAAEAEVARLKVVPQKINDAIWQYCERDDDGMIDIDNITAIIAKIAGDGSLGDDSLWFTGEQWATVVGDLDEARAEIARLRSALELAAQFVAKANADGAYDNTAMRGDRALRIISAALAGRNEDTAE